MIKSQIKQINYLARNYRWSRARSKRTLNAISRRALENKLIMWAMIVLLSLGVMFLLYLQLFGFGGGDVDHEGANATEHSGLRTRT